jgi:Family of unknown function (DUF6364)
MRVVLSIERDVLDQVKHYARSRSLSLGKAVSELLRQALATRRSNRLVNGLQVFDLPANSPKITTKKVLELDQ